MTPHEALDEALIKAYGGIVPIEGLHSDFQLRGFGTDGLTLLHMPCGGKVVARFGEQAEAEAILAAQESHWCPIAAEGVTVG
ncbi:hypothetical protein HY948_01800 [Candidatus Gottesmanbacteria bacterium]|nr:hypothetical protein [Candidatus Gottesmanbacteria bacterium]